MRVALRVLSLEWCRTWTQQCPLPRQAVHLDGTWWGGGGVGGLTLLLDNCSLKANTSTAHTTCARVRAGVGRAPAIEKMVSRACGICREQQWAP